MDGDVAPEFELSDLTIDQHGMLELLGKPRIVEYRLVEFKLEPPKIAGVPSIAAVRRLEMPCPLVRVLGRERLILPNGDVSEFACWG